MTLSEIPTNSLWSALRKQAPKPEFIMAEPLSGMCEGKLNDTLPILTVDLDEVVLELARRIPQERAAVRLIRDILKENA